MITRKISAVEFIRACDIEHIYGANAQQSEQLVRYGATTAEGKQMLRVFAQGVAAMKALPPQDPRSWAFQWYVHATPQPRRKCLRPFFRGLRALILDWQRRLGILASLTRVSRRIISYRGTACT